MAMSKEEWMEGLRAAMANLTDNDMLAIINKSPSNRLPPNYRPSAFSITWALNSAMFIGGSSPNFKYETTAEVMKRYAKYGMLVEGKMVPDEISYIFGSSVSEAKWLIDEFGGSISFTDNIVRLAYQYMPLLPHPPNPNVVVPLFIAFTVITTLIMGLRLWSRYKVAGGIQPFDWLAVVGFFLTVAWGGTAVYHDNISELKSYNCTTPNKFLNLFPNGAITGTHWQAFYDKSWYNLEGSISTYFALTLFYPWVMMVIKLSLLLFYYRMTNWNYIRWSVYVTTFIVVGTSIASFIVWLIQCPHVQYWKYPWEIKQCRIDLKAAQMAFASLYILTDIIIWVLPMPLVFQLKLYPRERLLALITFSLGGIACVASCFRLYMLAEFSNYSSEGSTTLLIDAWTITELNLALICASAPAVRALAIHYAPKILNSLGTVAFTNTQTGRKASVGSSNGSSAKAGPRVTTDPEK
ncbi:hypothetical protein TWF730_008409 [Orbilia blumenaviensis]|uniref:Rhodopsin domain-containing protein n=1 Tax=Orbilia blumenaviensis TaxID=1796055 RepID=A0AAV9V3H3_9PEZI